MTVDRHGNQGILDGASKSQLESEFGSSNEDTVITTILEKGSIITGEVGRRALVLEASILINTTEQRT